MPTINVPRGNMVPVAHFEYDLDACIDSITFLPTGRERHATWRESLDLNYTDGIIVLHKGKIVYEKYESIYAPIIVHISANSGLQLFLSFVNYNNYYVSIISLIICALSLFISYKFIKQK